jgi:tetratricopeptide (TPR) repeat protein
MNGIYMFHDLLLGRLLHLAGPDATVMLVSDHGFYSDHLRPVEVEGGPPVGPEAWHRHHGVFVLKGPNVLKDERVYGASLLDVTPTILTLLGLPVGRDMDGKVLVQCFDKPVEVERIDSWETEPGDAGMHPPDARSDPFEQQEAMRQLVELGYLAAPTDDAKKLIDLATMESRYNLAMVHVGAAEFGKATPILEQLVAEHPDESRFALSLAQVYLNTRRLPEARKLIGSAKTEGLASAQRDLMLGTLEFAEGRRDEALATLLRAERAEPRLPHLHTQLGNVYLQQRRWEDAGRAFEKALAIDGDSAQAHYGLGIVAFHQDRHDDAAELLLRSVGLTHYFPRAHFALGMTLARMGWYDRAVQSLKVALSQAPHFVSAHRFLSVCYSKLGNAEMALTHRQLAQRILDAQAKSAGAAKSQTTS